MFKGVKLFQGVRLLCFPNFLGGTFILDGTIIPYFRAQNLTYFGYPNFNQIYKKGSILLGVTEIQKQEIEPIIY